MKRKTIITRLAVGLGIAMGFCAASCSSDDDFTASIFDVNEYPLDRSLYSFPLDSFTVENFLKPYNLKFMYKMEDIASDLQKNLVPASYDKSVELAVLSKYLWYDVYQKYAGDEFLKLYSPREIHVIGSASYNPSQGTETLGTAEGGLKITLYKVNNLNVQDLDFMNEYFFKTMHHEFGHILDQTSQRPNSFDLISSGLYNVADWGNTHDSIAACRGFITPYASSQAREDWVEVLANYIVQNQQNWDRVLACAGFDWEEIDLDSYWENLRDDYLVKLYPKRAKSFWTEDNTSDNAKAIAAQMKAGTFKIPTDIDIDSVGYIRYMDNGDFKVVRKVIERNGDGTAVVDGDGNLHFIERDGILGDMIIMNKLEMVKEWLKTNWNIDIEDLRNEVQKRQYLTDANGEFVYDSNGNFINRLTQPLESDPTKTLIESLVDQVEWFKQFQTK